MLDTLAFIGNILNSKKITWGVGGSLLLTFHELIDNPNDIDILLDENHASQLHDLISPFVEVKKSVRSHPFRTKHFYQYQINKKDIDMMGGFGIQHNEGVYKLSFNKDSIVDYKYINGVDIPLSSLEDWYILYLLIPNKIQKADIIENHLRTKGIKHSYLFKKALKQPLPICVKNKIIELLS